MLSFVMRTATMSPRRHTAIADEVPAADVELSNTMAPQALMEEPERAFSLEMLLSHVEDIITSRVEAALDAFRDRVVDIADRRIEAHREKLARQAYLDGLKAEEDKRKAEAEAAAKRPRTKLYAIRMRRG